MEPVYAECLIPSVGYGDYLAVTLPANKGYFTHTVVVTSIKDEETEGCGRLESC